MQNLHKVSVQNLRGVGPQLAEKLKKLRIETIQDLVFHLPLRYVDKTKISPIGSLQPLTSAVIEGTIKACDVVFGRRRSLVCKLQDNTGIVTVRFYHFTWSQQRKLRIGTKLRCFGEIRRGSSGSELYHPEYTVISDDFPIALDDKFTPVYPTGDGITQTRIRRLCALALAELDNNSLIELLPSYAVKEYSLITALKFLHNPPVTTELHILATGRHLAQRRLICEELVSHQLSLLQLRQKIQRHPATSLVEKLEQRDKFLAQLSFKLTPAQLKASAEISHDMTKPTPMLRLLQGDVGSGKTIVSALAALQAIANGQQTALMAPTELLSAQHRLNFENWFKPLGIKIAWLSGKLKGKARDYQLNSIADGSAKMVIGTHALFQEKVKFFSLGLSIIDEQHRFGVHQRLALNKKGVSSDVTGQTLKQLPHQLIMTATPIPRTLAMSLYTNLDFSVIDELPIGRKRIETTVVDSSRRAEVIKRVAAACVSGRQAYWVCTLIEESESIAIQAAEVIANELKLLLPGLDIGLVHGRLKADEKINVMNNFRDKKINLLVATTVIEVGVDIPNASLIIVENSERLGLSQLHQLRGRVGRGADQSHCVLLYNAPLSHAGKERLRMMRNTNDGFKIAEKDLELRGPGEVLGVRQTGSMHFRIADLSRDAYLMSEIKVLADQLIDNNPELVEHLIERWIGKSQEYVQA
tara:strand:+ start:3960 stop:6050 length:2091 start_codon:yes stop_codon:yes gene_type:complete